MNRTSVVETQNFASLLTIYYDLLRDHLFIA